MGGIRSGCEERAGIGGSLGLTESLIGGNEEVRDEYELITQYMAVLIYVQRLGLAALKYSSASNYPGSSNP